MPDTQPKLPEPDAYGPSADYSERTEPHYRADTVRRLLADGRRQALEEAAQIADRRSQTMNEDRQLEAQAIAYLLRALKDKP